MSTHTFQFGEVTLTVEAPDGFPLEVDLNVHARDRGQFVAAVDAFGGLASFRDVDTDAGVRWLSAREQGDSPDGVYAGGTVFLSHDMRGGRVVANPAMDELARQQKLARERGAVERKAGVAS